MKRFFKLWGERIKRAKDYDADPENRTAGSGFGGLYPFLEIAFGWFFVAVEMIFIREE